MEQIEKIMILGTEIKVTVSPESRSYKPSCEYLKRGFCQVCDCDKCEGGFLVEEWKESMRQGCYTGSPRECSCVQLARNRKRLRESGLDRLVDRCTFDSFEVKNKWQAIVKNKALDYLKDSSTKGFFISGQSGSGKTHICTAICNEIIKGGGRLKYFQWVKDGTRLKQIVNERDQYESEIDALIKMQYLYMDDLFKQEVSSADIRLVYEIINGRYNADRPTIISSERNLDFIRRVRGGDGEAIAGRIYETCGKGQYCIELSGRDKNQRFL